MDGLGRPLLKSVRRDDGWWVVSAARYGPTEAELARQYHVGRRDSAEKSIDFNARLVEALTSNDCTLSEIPAEAWEQLVVTG